MLRGPESFQNSLNKLLMVSSSSNNLTSDGISGERGGVRNAGFSINVVRKHAKKQHQYNFVPTFGRCFVGIRCATNDHTATRTFQKYIRVLVSVS